MKNRDNQDSSSEKEKKSLDHALYMMSVGTISIIVIGILIFYHPDFDADHRIWFIRIVLALAAAASSMSLTGSIEVETHDFEALRNGGQQVPLKEKFISKYPKISATGALAVFVLIYLVDPVATYLSN